MQSLMFYSLGFVLLHILVSGTVIREKLIGMFGLKVYMALYNLASLALLVMAVISYNHAPMVETWGQVAAMRWLAALLMLIAFILLGMGVMSRNPTAMGKEESLYDANVVRGTLHITRHPVLNAIALWAIVHIIFNGDQASLIFFGAMLITCVAGMPSIDAKLAKQYGEKWQQFAAQTSRLPFVAILQGRTRLTWSELDIRAIIIGIILYAIFASQHGRLFGVAVM